jgi:hypothetical protein
MLSPRTAAGATRAMGKTSSEEARDRRLSTETIMATCDTMAGHAKESEGFKGLETLHEKPEIEHSRSLAETVARQQNALRQQALTIHLLRDELHSYRADEGLTSPPPTAVRRKTPNRSRPRPGTSRERTPPTTPRERVDDPTTRPTVSWSMGAREEVMSHWVPSEERRVTRPMSDEGTTWARHRGAPYRELQRAMRRHADAAAAARHRDWASRARSLEELRCSAPPRVVPWAQEGEFAGAIQMLCARARDAEQAPAGDESMGRLVAGWKQFAERRNRVLAWDGFPPLELC